jgi:ComF family protein
MRLKNALALLELGGNAALQLFLAPMCAACEAPLTHPLRSPVCPACWRAVARLPAPGEAGGPLAFEAARSAGQYEGSLRAIIHAFKYDRRRALAAPLAAMMRDAGAALLEEADAVVPVPLHPWKRLTRGFNQADDLARHLGRPVWRVLRRRRHGPPQAGLPAARRHANVRDAFAARSGRLRGATVVLVDDVMTTGATLDACGRVLLAAGARSVRALTVARAAAGRPLPPPP